LGEYPVVLGAVGGSWYSARGVGEQLGCEMAGEAVWVVAEDGFGGVETGEFWSSGMRPEGSTGLPFS
jgi:hypothetical protein